MVPPGEHRPRVVVCLGTRPEAIKLAPVIERLASDGRLEAVVVSTGQHREMLDQMLALFGIRPAVDLRLMRADQPLGALAGDAVGALSDALQGLRPDAVLVQGDTTTAMCAALAAAYLEIPVGHVEAGLRSGDPARPFPEEINRRLITVLGRWHWCPTARAAAALAAENVPPERILVTGNTGIDALLAMAGRPLDPRRAALIPPRQAARRILVTLHRRETHGAAQRELCRMLARVAGRGDVDVLLPVHPSPAVRASVEAELGGVPGVQLVPPLDYDVFVHALKGSDLVVTDSGGLQEEAPVLGLPVLVMRDTTERTEGVEAGCALLSGTDPAAVERDIHRVLDDPRLHARMAQAASPYGDGHAAARIVEQLAGDLVAAQAG